MIAADSYGDDTAAAVIFAHGGGQSRGAWRATAQAFAKAGYHAVSIDLRGHGESDWADDGDYRFEAYVRDFAALIPDLGGRAALVGASLGGRAALLMATTHPGMVGALALADVTPRIDEEAADDMRGFFRDSVDGFASLEAAAELLATLSPDGRRAPLDRLGTNLRQDQGRYFWRWDPRFVEHRFVAGPDQLDLLDRSARTLRTPTIMIRAEHSTMVRAEHVDHFRSIAPHVETHVAPGIGHMLTGDANDAYAPLILDFMRRAFPA